MINVVLQNALNYRNAGLPVIPIRPDGTKRPSMVWKPFQSRFLSEDEVRQCWESGTDGIALVAGEIGGGLEFIDFDNSEYVGPWSKLIEAEAPGLLAKLTRIRTPTGGSHFAYRCPGKVQGNQKLAEDIDRNGKRVTLIETRGEGGYVLTVGCPPACHPTNRQYSHAGGPPLTEISTISPSERDILLRAARSFDCMPARTKPANSTEQTDGLRPGEDYDQRGPKWADILEPFGWVNVCEYEGKIHWRRPGKEDKGWSATTGYCTGSIGEDLLAVFSSNADPFEGPAMGRTCSCYGKFRAFALLNYGGDLRRAAADLAIQGFGERAGYTSSQDNAPSPDDFKPIMDEVPFGEHEPFPVHALPSVLQQFAKEVAASMSCSLDLPCVAILVAAATAIGASRAISVKRRWLECPRLYVAMVSDPGSAKSPVVSEVCRPIYRYQNHVYAEWEKVNAEYQQHVEEYNRSRKKGFGGVPSEAPRKPPKLSRQFTTNATTESLAVILRDNPRGIALIADEVTGWVMSMNQYKGGKGSDRQFWLSSWSGEPAIVDRKSTHEQGPLVLHHPFVNVFGGLPPDMLSVLCDEEAREDGFVHRILFSYPTPTFGADWTDTAITERSEQSWAVAIQRMLDLQMETDEDGKQWPRIVQWTAEGKALWVRWYNEHANEMRDTEFPYSLIGPWSKLRSYAARIALTIQFLRLVCEETDTEDVDGDSMERAGAIMSYFKSHARRVYGCLQTTIEDRKAKQAFEWIVKNGGQCTIRELIRSRLVKKKSEGVGLLKDLQDRGLGAVVEQAAQNNKVVQIFVAASQCHKDY